MESTGIKEFLEQNELVFSKQVIAETAKKFAHDMGEGLAGRDSSLMMLPTYITAEGQLPKNERVIVVDAGGTNLRVAVCRYDENSRTVVEYFDKSRMPGSECAIDVEDFFLAVAKKLLPIINNSHKIGICFSYAAKVLPNKDASIIGMSKEVVLYNSKGALVCDGISRALKKLGIKEEKSFVLINDTVAALLGAKADCDPASYDGFAGFILGTGTNIAYSESCSGITKSPEIASAGGSMIVNMESGYFDKVVRGKVDLQLDDESRNPGLSVAEKLISGAYIGKISLRMLAEAAGRGMLSEETAEAVAKTEELPMWEVDKFLGGRESLLDSVLATKEDRQTANEIITAVFERAAGIVCAEFKAIAERTGAGKSGKPICVCTEGTTVNKSPVYKPIIEKMVEENITNESGAKLEFVFVEDATLKGTALAAALNCK